MARLIVQYLAIICNYENLHNSKKCLYRFKILAKTKYTLENVSKKLLNIFQSGEISPNLVTLVGT